VLTKELL